MQVRATVNVRRAANQGYSQAIEDSDSRIAIKEAALDLLVRHGYRGMSFGDIAAVLGITRANIHYHFGSKAALIDEVLADYVDTTLTALRSVWMSDGTTLAAKLEGMLSYSRNRYARFNRARQPVRPWSLISRLRQDEELLSAAGRARLRRFTAELHEIFLGALQKALIEREISKATSPAALSLLLVAIADNAAPITMAEGGFAELEATYRALLQV
jgi:TetR/AcrR family transcriptional repressor of nem operon